MGWVDEGGEEGVGEERWKWEGGWLQKIKGQFSLFMWGGGGGKCHRGGEKKIAGFLIKKNKFLRFNTLSLAKKFAHLLAFRTSLTTNILTSPLNKSAISARMEAWI